MTIRLNAHPPATPRANLRRVSDQRDARANALLAKRLQVRGPVRLGDSDQVTVLAKRLIGLSGHDAGTGRGFDARAAGALRDFQKARGLPATGELDRASFRELQAVQARVRRSGGANLGVGQKDARIVQAERQLGRLGYDVGRADGVMDGRLADAVKGFRRDQGGDAREPTGVMTERLRRALSSEVKATRHAPYRTRVKPSSERRRLDALTWRVLQDGPLVRGAVGRDARRAVANVQGHLRAAGLDPKHRSGTFDDRTEGMVKLFQQKVGLPVTGRVDGATWTSLKRSTLEASSATSPAQALGERSRAVRRSEEALDKLGFGAGAVDGFFTARTEAAVRRFQRENGLQVKGRVDARTLGRVDAKLEAHLGPVFTGTAYRAGQAYRIKLVKVDGLSMSLPTGRAFLKMKAAARRDGVDLDLVSGFRTMAEQRELWNRYGSPRAARPGYSNHQSGLAVDIETANGTNASFRWLTRNAGRFGFKRTVSYEPWHWEYRP